MAKLARNKKNEWFKRKVICKYFALCTGICIVLAVYVSTFTWTMKKPLAVKKDNKNILLDKNLLPCTVHYVWCGKRWFEFTHYLSMKSVLKEVRPDLIIFHYEFLPTVDNWIYNTWFDELRKEFPFIYVRAADQKEQICLKAKKPNPKFIYTQLSRHGGIYVHEQTMLLKFPIRLRKYDFIKGIDEQTGYGLLLAKKGFPNMISSTARKYKAGRVKCIPNKSFKTQSTETLCINIESTIFPKDIWMRNDEFGRATRQVFYGSPEIRVATPNNDSLIPNVAHMVWLGGGRMDFLFYLSVLSLLHVANVEKLFIHGDAPPKGPYWERVKDHPRLHLTFREVPHTVFGTNVNDLSHVSDIWRVDFMIKYGGIYLDTDAVFVKPLDHFIRSFDAVASYDWKLMNPPFPDVINFGVMAGKKNATYWHLFQKSMNWFRDKDWTWNGLRQPYKLQEKYPNLIRVDPRLQVICYHFRCHPTWHPQYQNERIDHLNSRSIKDWKVDTYAFHWTYPTPPELKNEAALYRSNTMFAKIGQFILEKSGVKNKQS